MIRSRQPVGRPSGRERGGNGRRHVRHLLGAPAALWGRLDRRVGEQTLVEGRDPRNRGQLDLVGRVIHDLGYGDEVDRDRVDRRGVGLLASRRGVLLWLEWDEARGGGIPERLDRNVEGAGDGLGLEALDDQRVAPGGAEEDGRGRGAVAGGELRLWVLDGAPLVDVPTTERDECTGARRFGELQVLLASPL